jgi:mevalonate kinase
MNPKSMIAILLMVAAPVCAQAQKPTRADAQKVFEIISGNEVKAQIFCDIGKLGDEIEQAAGKKDTKTADELRRQIDDLGRKLGPEYAALMNGIQNVDPESEDGQQISSTIQALDKLCALE